MCGKMERFIAESKIINFLASIPKNLITFFMNSATYKLFIKGLSFFKGVCLINAGRSRVIKFCGKVPSSVKRKDVGIFIILVVILNTSAVLILEKEKGLDIFSIIGRVFFFFLGLTLILAKRRQ